MADGRESHKPEVNGSVDRKPQANASATHTTITRLRIKSPLQLPSYEQTDRPDTPSDNPAMAAPEAPTSTLVAAAQSKTEAYLGRIEKQRAQTLAATDLEGAVPYEKKYVGAFPMSIRGVVGGPLKVLGDERVLGCVQTLRCVGRPAIQSVGRFYFIPSPNPTTTINQSTYTTTGKVRDVYTTQDSLILVSTDRQSAFDRNLASIPFKGQVLNLTSQWCVKRTCAFTYAHVCVSGRRNAWGLCCVCHVAKH